jgi:hypothetical protein
MNRVNPDFEIDAESDMEGDMEDDAEEMPAPIAVAPAAIPAAIPIKNKIEVNAEVIPFEHVNSMKLPKKAKKAKKATQVAPFVSGQIAETIVIDNQDKILPRLTKQEKKWWHFKFADQNDEIKLQRAFDKMNATVTIKLNDCGKKHPDILLTRNDTTVGKIHFLYFDRRDKDDPSKYYVKVFFYQMNQHDFETAKDIIVRFFAELAKGEGDQRQDQRHDQRHQRHKKHRTLRHKKKRGTKKKVRFAM